MGDDRTPKRMLFASMPKPRPQGGPPQRWMDGVRKDLKEMGTERTWMQDAQNRGEWKQKTRETVEGGERKRQDKDRETYIQKKAATKTFPCDKCEKSFPTEAGLKLHRSQVHQPYAGSGRSRDKIQCDVPGCTAWCTPGGGMAGHKMWKHPVASSSGDAGSRRTAATPKRAGGGPKPKVAKEKERASSRPTPKPGGKK